MPTEQENTQGTETETQENETENAEQQAGETDKEFAERGRKIVELKDSNRTLQVELDKLKAQQKKLDDNEKMKKGQYDTLISEKEKEIEDFRKQLEEANTYKEKFEKIQEDTKKELLAKLTKTQRAEWEDEPIETIRKFVKNLPANGNSVDTDNGNASGKDVKLTDSQKQEARTMGVSDEVWYELNKERQEKNALRNSQIKK